MARLALIVLVATGLGIGCGSGGGVQPDGATGAAGTTGVAGVSGAAGVEGTAGTSGTAGVTGAAGSSGGGAGTTGAAGVSGPGGTGGAGTSGAAGHGAGTGGTTGAAGQQGDGGQPTCNELKAQYAAAISTAKSCNVAGTAQCQELVSSSLPPCCMTYVNTSTKLNQIKAAWTQAGCAATSGNACDGIRCAPPKTNTCVASAGGGACVASTSAAD